MRKNFAKVCVCAVAMTMLFSLSACGKEEEKDTKTKTEASSEPADTTDEADDTDDTDVVDEADMFEDKFASIEEYLNDPTVKSQLDAMIESMKDSGMTMAISGDGNKLIYTYTYTDMAKADGMAESLQAGLESEKDTFTSIAASLQTMIEVENPVVVVEYIDCNGETIYSQEFAAE